MASIESASETSRLRRLKLVTRANRLRDWRRVAPWILIFFGVFWWGIAWNDLYPTWYYALYSDGYSRASFIVGDVRVGRSGKGRPYAVASGTISGQDEQYDLLLEVVNFDHIEDAYPRGTEIVVLHNPQVQHLTSVGLVRNLPSKFDAQRPYQRALLWSIPTIISLIAGFLLWIFQRRHRSTEAADRGFA